MSLYRQTSRPKNLPPPPPPTPFPRPCKRTYSFNLFTGDGDGEGDGNALQVKPINFCCSTGSREGGRERRLEARRQGEGGSR